MTLQTCTIVIRNKILFLQDHSLDRSVSESWMTFARDMLVCVYVYMHVCMYWQNYAVETEKISIGQSRKMYKASLVSVTSSWQWDRSVDGGGLL